MKTLLEMRPEQIAILEEVCARDGVSRAEAIRRAINYYGAHVLPVTPLDAHFGYFKGRKINSLAYVDKLRNEW